MRHAKVFDALVLRIRSGRVNIFISRISLTTSTSDILISGRSCSISIDVVSPRARFRPIQATAMRAIAIPMPVEISIQRGIPVGSVAVGNWARVMECVEKLGMETSTWVPCVPLSSRYSA